MEDETAFEDESRIDDEAAFEDESRSPCSSSVRGRCDSNVADEPIRRDKLIGCDD